MLRVGCLFQRTLRASLESGEICRCSHFSQIKQLSRKAKLGDVDIDHCSARNLRQRLGQKITFPGHRLVRENCIKAQNSMRSRLSAQACSVRREEPKTQACLSFSADTSCVVLSTIAFHPVNHVNPVKVMSRRSPIICREGLSSGSKEPRRGAECGARKQEEGKGASQACLD